MNAYHMFSMRELFMNEQLKNVFPQFGKIGKLQNVYSYAQVEKQVAEYLAGALNGSITGDGELTVRGKYKDVLGRVRQLQALIEEFFDSTPKIVANLRKNTALYLPYAARNRIAELKTPASKARAMREVLDNLQYNSDCGALNSIKHETPAQFARNKRKWEEKVGKRRKGNNE